MTPQFLRDEAARFRSMADTSDRASSKARLLAMAIDYEARAAAFGPEPGPDEQIKVKVSKKITLRAAREPKEAVPVEPYPDDQQQ